MLAVQSVTEATYDHVVYEMLPVLQDMKQEGLVRQFGLTEWFYDDTSHKMATRAVTDGYWDYLLLGFNLLDQSAARHVLTPRAGKRRRGGPDVRGAPGVVEHGGRATIGELPDPQRDDRPGGDRPE